MTNSKANDSLFEAILRQALIENRERELSELLVEAEKYKDYILPEKYEIAIKKLFDKDRRKEMSKRTWKVLKVSAAVIVISLSLFSGVLLITSPPVRAIVRDVIVEWFDKFTKFSSGSENDAIIDNPETTNNDIGGDTQMPDITKEKFYPAYLPEGFNESDILDAGDISTRFYTNSSGTEISFSFFPKNASISVDNENKNYTVFNQEGTIYHIFESKNNEENKIIWEMQSFRFKLTSSVDMEELKKIALSIKADN